MTDETPKKNKGGGRRPGSGRKKGVPNKITLAERKKALEGGFSPLQILTNLARDHYDAYLKERRKGIKVDDAKLMEKAKAAESAAEKAAPYIHSKMPTALHHSGPGGGPIPTLDLTKLTDEQLAALEPVISALAAAGGLAGADPEGEGTPEA
ncbi:hypothetical protein [Labrys sp. ZIDIC5]|uniref:hypothetical protein n=1 Tax=Labrys sedimenti TaxID=3106036 RepID=UPI002ACAF799|nr:hypothetical protein [Labrys sp. ZIDIC5]MDZ5448941.1 hypothetical protein [Labrys sp. ZIDIC5]